MEYKEIHWDSIITEFGTKGALYVHFRAGKKLKDIKSIDQILDKHLKGTFYKEVRPTGDFIKSQIEAIDGNRFYSPKADEKIQFTKGRSLFYRQNLPQERPEEFIQAQELYRELMKLYDSEEVIHKSYSEEFKGWDYVIHYKSPFIDELMVILCKEINEELVSQGFVLQ